MQPPGGVDDVLDEMALEFGGGVEFFVALGAAGLVGFEVFPGEDDGLAGEAVVENVEAGTGFALRASAGRWS